MFADGHADPWAVMAQGAPAPAPAPAALPPPPPPRAPDGAPPPAALPRYLDLLRLLTGGAGGPAPAARRLSELERGAVRHADLKQALAANGLAAGARGKAELLARLEGLPLRDPTHVGAGAGGAAEAPEALLAALRALGWAAPASEDAAAAALARDGFYSYCPLPGVAVAAGAAAAPMDEDAGAARSPEPEQEQAPEPEPAPAPEPEAPEAGEWPPPWLAASVAAVAAESRASGEAAAGAALVGRKVACVFAEAYEPPGGGGALARGARVGRVVEHVGAAHDEDACAPGCAQRHEYCYVRFNLPARPPGRRARGNPAAPAPARVDLAVDLQPGMRAASLEALLALRGAQLADAWALLEPRAAEG
jgi:hypothetical protein